MEKPADQRRQRYAKLGFIACFAAPLLVVLAIAALMISQRLEAVFNPWIVAGCCTALALLTAVATLVFGILSPREPLWVAGITYLSLFCCLMLLVLGMAAGGGGAFPG